jgi:hypothetical protein
VHAFQPDLSSGVGGRGVNAQLDTDLTMERVLVKNVSEMGVFVAADTHAKLTDVVIEEVHNVGILGTGLTFNFGATAEIERMRISRFTQGGLAMGDGSVVVMSDVAIEDGLGLESDQSEGLGIAIQTGSRLTASRLSIERCRDQALFVRDPETEAVIDDLIVREIQVDAISGRFGRGVGVELGASTTIRRGSITATHEHALMVNGGGAILRGEDLRVDDTRSRLSDGQSGRGAGVQVDAHLELTRAHFSNSHEVGLFISGESATATLTDVVVEKTESRPDGVGGRGLDVSLGAKVIARGILVRDNREFGVVAVHEGSRVDLFDAIVSGTRENACPAEECLGFGKGGTGVAAAKSAALRMNHFLVEKSAVAGLALTRAGTIDLFDGEVAFNPVGVNVDAEGYDLDRLRNEVRYHDNDLTLQSISLPEPRASDPIAGALE